VVGEMLCNKWRGINENLAIKGKTNCTKTAD
jgi:hypothetical protein